MKKPSVCPYCNVELEDIEVTNHENYVAENNQYIDEMAGTCPQCKRDYHWNNVFTYSRSWGFKEDIFSGDFYETKPES